MPPVEQIQEYVKDNAVTRRTVLRNAAQEMPSADPCH